MSLQCQLFSSSHRSGNDAMNLAIGKWWFQWSRYEVGDLKLSGDSVTINYPIKFNTVYAVVVGGADSTQSGAIETNGYGYITNTNFKAYGAGNHNYTITPSGSFIYTGI